MTTLTAPAVGQKVLLPNVDWRTYKRMLWALAEYPGLRITYDRGMLEIMTKSPQHERSSALLRQLLEGMAAELAVNMIAFGGPTCFRPRTRGLEPDECYYIARAHLVVGKTDLDLRTDPAPDLVLEVDITSSSIDRLGIYAVMGVSEVWIFDGTALAFHLLQPNGTYQVALNSLAFPCLTSTDLLRFLMLSGPLYDREIIAQFRAWVRQQASGPPTP